MQILFYTSRSGRQPVAEFIRSLSKVDQGRFSDLRAGIEAYGLDYDRAQFRHLQGKLWEIKIAGEGASFRIAYVVIDQESMVWIHAFIKDGQKTPAQDLALAMRRMKEVFP